MSDNIKFFKELGKRIAELRKEKGLSQEELGKKAKKSRQVISRFELGEVRPSISTLLAISKVLEVDITIVLSFSTQNRINSRLYEILKKLNMKQKDVLLKTAKAIIEMEK